MHCRREGGGGEASVSSMKRWLRHRKWSLWRAAWREGCRHHAAVSADDVVGCCRSVWRITNAAAAISCVTRYVGKLSIRHTTSATSRAMARRLLQRYKSAAPHSGGVWNCQSVMRTCCSSGRSVASVIVDDSELTACLDTLLSTWCITSQCFQQLCYSSTLRDCSMLVTWRRRESHLDLLVKTKMQLNLKLYSQSI